MRTKRAARTRNIETIRSSECSTRRRFPSDTTANFNMFNNVHPTNESPAVSSASTPEHIHLEPPSTTNNIAQTRRHLRSANMHIRGIAGTPTDDAFQRTGYITNITNSTANTVNVGNLTNIQRTTQTPSNTCALWDFGPPDRICTHCGAIVWFEERNNKKKVNDPTFSICCQVGKIELPRLNEPPHLLHQLLSSRGSHLSRNFRDNIRAYNSIFAFTSIGAHIDYRINDGRGPYVFRISGQNYHQIGTLMPRDNQMPKFAQLYFHDTQDEVHNRLQVWSNHGERQVLDPLIVEELITMFDEYNELAKVFRSARDRFAENQFIPVRIRLIGTRTKDSRQYNLPTSSEVAALIVGNEFQIHDHRDVIVQDTNAGLRRITELHPSFMAMQYPILFPYGEDGYTTDILFRNGTTHEGRTTISIREYYAYRLQQRSNEGSTLLRGGRLFQQFVVDAYTCIEEERLNWYRRNQATCRADLYKGLTDSIVAGDTSAGSIGKRLVLPSSFVGGPRYMLQSYQDAIAICRWAGPPDLFITFTCNPKWNEIRSFLDIYPGQRSEDRPDIVVRAFKIKVDQIMKDFRQERKFGRVIAALKVIEFQKRGLPHAHILLFLHPDDKPRSPSDIDKIISAELPNRDQDPVLYEIVVDCMIHGPCGKNINEHAPCMFKDLCLKHYPKDFCDQTIFDEDGFAKYKRRRNDATAKKNGIQVDNSWVVPYNADLVKKYNAHINVEFCNRSRMIKYLFKYINKGHDRSTVVIEDNVSAHNINGQTFIRQVDEIQTFLDCRYISAPEACWRTFGFEVQFRDPPVQRLSFHLEDEQTVIFHDHDNIVDVLNRRSTQKTMFTEWMETNKLYEDARELTYVEFPTKWVWNKEHLKWTRRQKRTKIGRIHSAHPNSGERFYTRMLLNIKKGPRNYKELKTVNNVEYIDCKSACFALGLLEDNNQWNLAILEASEYAGSSALRYMFMNFLLLCELTNPAEFWNTHWKLLSDDILRRARNDFDNQTLRLSEEQLQNYTLYEIEKLLNQNNRSLKEFQNMPFPDMSFIPQMQNRLIADELMYDRTSMQFDFERLHCVLNVEQKQIFDIIINAVQTKSGGFYFVYGAGGTGKTYLWNTIITKLRSNGRIVLAVASSGIAALLFPGGKTAHSRFKIPLETTEVSCCDISKRSLLADLIRQADLIIWDEAPMTHRHDFEAVDRTFQDLLGISEDEMPQIFGGKTMLLGGDFRQILPVVEKGSRQSIVAASINRSHIWNHCQVFKLTRNMRLDTNSASSIEFSQWILDLGEGKLPVTSINESDERTWIKIPEDLLITNGENSIDDIVNTIYADISTMYMNRQYFRDRCILTPKNDSVDEVNDSILSSFPGEMFEYLSADTVSPASEIGNNQHMSFPPEFLHDTNMSGLPNHVIQLKVGVPIMLLRNINQSKGLCNGTRLIIIRLGTNVMEAEILTGNKIGNKELLHRIITTAKVKKWAFIIRRTQFPIKLCFSMTINKSQGQTLQHVGVYLPRPVFSHDQLYVAVSRTTTRKGLKILLKNKQDEPPGHTQNIVYHEIFNNLDQGMTQ